MNKHNYAVIMAGGIGSRLWPYSRTKFPKQFQDLLNVGRSLLQLTFDRIVGICPEENIFIVTNKDYAETIFKQLPFLKKHQVLLEPIGKNTAPCIAYACTKIQKIDPNARVVVLPSDHIIMKEVEFRNKITLALNHSSENSELVILGINPTRPDTGYGYIQYWNSHKDFKKVKTFTEKPELELAQVFLDSGDFVWNAGIFVWKAETIINEIKKYLPDLAELFDTIKDEYFTDKESDLIVKIYSQCKNISIDKGIMEKTNNVSVLLCEFGWSDVGTWKSLYDVREKTLQGNVIDGNVITYDTNNCIIKLPKEKLAVLHGLDDYIVAEYDDVLMICKKEDEQKVRDFVADVKANKEAKFV